LTGNSLTQFSLFRTGEPQHGLTPLPEVTLLQRATEAALQYQIGFPAIRQATAGKEILIGREWLKVRGCHIYNPEYDI
jgi:hypothetical protein